MKNENKTINPSFSPVYRKRVKDMIEMAKNLSPTGKISTAQKNAVKYFANPLAEDFSARRNVGANAPAETDAIPTDSVKI